MNERPRYKGKIMTEKQYKRRMKQIECGLKRKKEKVQTEDPCEEPQCTVEGRRLIDMKVMAEHLYCSFCKEILSLEDIEKEERKGLASIFTIRCRKCLATTSVPTSKVHKGPNGQLVYDTNSKAALAAIHCGYGHTSLNKYCSLLNQPFMTAKTFKSYEREIGPVIETVAKGSCIEACKEERRLTISHLDILEKHLVLQWFDSIWRGHSRTASNNNNEVMRDDVNKNIKQVTKTIYNGAYTPDAENPTEVSILLLLRQTLTALGPMLSTVCIGITFGYSAILLAQLEKNTHISEESHANILIRYITTNDESWLAASGALLMAPGCWLSGILMEFFGRRVTHLIISPVFCLAWIAIGLAPNMPTLIFGRLLCGLCVGLQAPLGPVYVAEISEPQFRGILLSAISLAVSIGILFVHVVGSFVSWEDTALISMVFPILCFLICLNAPESPSWLLKKNKSTLARESWIYLRGLNSFEEFEKIGLAEQYNTRRQDIEPACNYSKQNSSEAHGTSELTIVECEVGVRTAQEEPNVKSIVESIQTITQEQSTPIPNIHQDDQNSQKQKIKSVKKLLNIWTNAMFWKPLIILNIFFFIAQFSGVNVLSFYGVQLLKELMTSTENAYLATILVDLVRVLASVLACWMTKKFSRRSLAITSATGAFLSLLTLSGVVFWNVATSWIPLFLLLIFVCAVSIGLVPLPWLLCGEIFPTSVRALGTGISSACAFIYFFVVVRLGPFMLKDLGSSCTFFIFGLITLIGTCLLYFFLPETKDKTLTDIGRYFQTKKNDV